MKKLLYLLLIGMLITSQAHAVNLWKKGTDADVIAGGDSPADIDTLLEAFSSDPIDRLMDAYRSDAVCLYASASTLTVSIGCVATDSSTGVHRMRENTSATTVTWSDIDTGAEASSTYYYVYAIADADATTFTITISTSSTAPTGVTYYKKIGWFHNDASSNIIEVGNVKTAGTPNIVKITGTDDISMLSATYVDMTDMVVYFVSSGRPVVVHFEAPVSTNFAITSVGLTIDIDGTDKKVTWADAINVDLLWVENLSAGTHTIKVQWRYVPGTSSNTSYQYGSTVGARILTVNEL